MPNRLDEARQILKELGMPPKQHNKISGLTLLALCRMNLNSPWSSARAESLTIRKGIMDHVAQVLGNPYAENSREQFRRFVLHQFVQAGISLYNPDTPDLPTNSQNNHYRLSLEALETVKAFGTNQWTTAKTKFLAEKGSLAQRYAKERELAQVPVTLLSGRQIVLSPGKHNEVQAAVVEEFAPRFAAGAVVLYLGDTAQKALIVEAAELEKLGIPLNQHNKMPDVVLFDKKRNWLFLIEAVTSHGPMTPKRLIELAEMLKKCSAGLVYVSAFPNFAEFKKHASDISWETEVWIVDTPEHMMHFNGDRFLGPR